MITVHTSKLRHQSQMELTNVSYQDMFCWFFPCGYKKTILTITFRKIFASVLAKQLFFSHIHNPFNWPVLANWHGFL